MRQSTPARGGAGLTGFGSAADHRGRLEALLDDFGRAVALEMPFERFDEPGARECFDAHYPSLSSSLEEWNTVIVQAQRATEALWRRFSLSARDHGITEPPFIVGALIDDLATWTIRMCRRWDLSSPDRAPLEHFRDRVAGNECVDIYLRGRRVAALPGGSDSEVARRVGAAESLIQGLFDEARTCPEARAILQTRDAVLDLQAQLLDDVDIAKTNGLSRAGACPVCEQAAGGRDP